MGRIYYNIQSKLISEFINSNARLKAQRSLETYMTRLKPLDYYVYEILGEKLDQNFINKLTIDKREILNTKSKKKSFYDFMNEFLQWVNNNNDYRPKYKNGKVVYTRPIGKQLDYIKSATRKFFNKYFTDQISIERLNEEVKGSDSTPLERSRLEINDISRILHELKGDIRFYTIPINIIMLTLI